MMKLNLARVGCKNLPENQGVKMEALNPILQMIFYSTKERGIKNATSHCVPLFF